MASSGGCRGPRVLHCVQGSGFHSDSLHESIHARAGGFGVFMCVHHKGAGSCCPQWRGVGQSLNHEVADLPRVLAQDRDRERRPS